MAADRGAFTRRGFLQTSAAVTAGVLVGGRLQAAEDPYGGFKMGLQSYTLRGFKVEEALKHTRDLGLKYWEAFPGHLPISTLPETISQQKDLLSQNEVTLLATGVVSFDSNETKAREFFDYAHKMGLVSISANPKKDAATFDLLDKLVEEYGIPIAIHNHGPGADYDKVDDVLTWTKDRHAKIGACVDTGHYLRSDENPTEVIEKLGARVFGVHFKDARSVRDPEEVARLMQELPKHRADQLKREGKVFTILGEGELDVAGCLKALRKLNYENSLSLEYEENEQNPLSDIALCLDAVRKAVETLNA